MGSPSRAEATFLRTLLIETKTPSEPMFRDPSRWGHPFGSSLFPLYPTCSIVKKDRFGGCFQLPSG